MIKLIKFFQQKFVGFFYHSYENETITMHDDKTKTLVLMFLKTVDKLTNEVRNKNEIYTDSTDL